ncbi:hypothetical protein [Verrucomicrobium spinosum]|uniref:hypothetical protein n=2 Tax=Verrucomicrobium spinosum TaxID=2736 RepID=UPI0001744E26|nr:hypothetical protein [Verrucomicrobium spinosum]
MQVSWIDEDELRALTSQLQGAFPEPKAGAPVGSSFPEVNEAVIANLLEGGPLPSSTSFARPAPTAPVPAPVRVAETSPAPADVPGGSLPPVVAVAVEAPLAVVPQMHVSVITPAPEPVGTVPDDSNRPEVAHIRDRLKAIRDRAQAAGLLPPAPDVPPVPLAEEAPAAPVWAAAEEQPRQTPDFSSLAQAVASISESDVNPPALHLPEDGTMAERLEGYTHWAARLTRAEQIILMDDYGDLLWGNPESNDLILTAMLALNASSRSRIPGAPAFLRSQLGQNRELHALPTSTRFGTVTLALINPAEISTATTGLLQDGLVRCIEGSVATAQG